MQAAFFIPFGKLRRPGPQVGPHQVAEFADFLLGIEFGAQIEKVQESPQAEADHKMLAVIKGQDAAGMFLGEAGGQQFGVALGGGAAEGKILRPLVCGVGVFLPLAVAVAVYGPEIEYLF